MRELKILAVIIVFTGFTYWGVEPLAHSIFHPHVDPADYKFSDLKDVDTKLTGDAEAGATTVAQNCTACHSIKSQGFNAPMDDATLEMSYGVVPPDLSNAGYLYEENFLANFIKNPTKALHLTHKFDKVGKAFPMPAYNWMGDQDIMNMVAYFKSIAPKTLTNREVFVDACGRCHDMDYAKLDGDAIVAKTSDATIKKYMGSVPPDLSMMIRSRGEHYLETFINDPQKQLHGTAMPRVGLSEKSQEQVIHFMEEIGDSKKEEREGLAWWVIGFMVIFSFVGFLWKKQIWDEVH
jgi:ubiquinol-cytochrome c reductase cytochrome c1 subunit